MGESNDRNCIFCKIANGEITSYKVYEDDDFIAILDVSPAAEGHTLVMPKRHAADIFELPEEYAQKAIVITKRLAAKIKTATNCEGINILQNNGRVAGQTIGHFHIHLIPRQENDNIRIDWEYKNSDNLDLTGMREKIEMAKN